MKNKICPIFDKYLEIESEKLSTQECLLCRTKKANSDEILSSYLECQCRNKIQREEYLKHVKKLYDLGYKFIIKVTDPNNKSFIFADNCLYETKGCVDFYNKYDGINHFNHEEAKEEADKFQQSHPNWIVQIKEISFDKQ